MRKTIFLLAALTVWVPAQAGETPTNSVGGNAGVNAIVSVAGADTSNATTATPFFIPLAVKLTIWCNAPAFIAINSRVAANATGNGMPVSTNEKFPTSTGREIVDQSGTAAAGGAIVRIFGTSAVTCYVNVRSGTE